ncbi:N-acetyl-gamma-glutamyl-phosphate reductase [Cytobacillus spongiae]|jgi:N-acetyl-gamma-glutamyl-phosphate reductase|uniref:N-acetyl-gamma-glutamyl-phosphate reductase n=1 Tax=Cytobacillus spongiae TaxID=2901381 RepID=UPI001F3DF23D|nr:N-acetyl-gamma-glutamyl-phosphate reductase [Cytobacillus spongiae]UII56989.1 N-acetyl-gamma-glutamyl-phosphate reductase [Cytobacillus spongiae]
MKVSIIGASGYSGVELIRLINQHNEFSLQSIHTSREETLISQVYPHLFQIIHSNLERIEPNLISEQADLIFLATPSGVSKHLAQEFSTYHVPIIDLSGDLRLKNDKEYEQWYKKPPAKKELIAEAVYGLPEWNKQQIQSAKWIANPGCYPTASLLGLAPVVKHGLIDPGSIIIDAKSGVSGAGRKAAIETSYSEMNENFRIYKVNEHQHIPEIEQQLQEWNQSISTITFNTHLLPITRGIMTTIYVQLKEEYPTEQIIELYQQMYKQQPFIRIKPMGVFPSIKEVRASNFCDIGLSVDRRTGRLVIVSVIDNLMKGAAGQAVQNANLLFGIQESEGLHSIPVYP